MLKNSKTFSSFSTDDMAKAKEFYVNILELKLNSEEMGLGLEMPDGAQVFIYEKPDHLPATFTVLNFVVGDIDKAVEELVAKGITFEQYDWGKNGKTDAKGIMRGKAAGQGPDIAWFKDPAGNILSVLKE